METKGLSRSWQAKAPAPPERKPLHANVGQTLPSVNPLVSAIPSRGASHGEAVSLRRRSLLGAGMAAIAGSAISCATGRSGSPWRFFTAAEAETLDAICAQLIPADQDPGAREARVVNYIDIQLSQRFRKHRMAYRQGLAGIDQTGRRKFAKRFVELGSEQQIEVLNAVEENSKAFFDLLLTHTRQGFYGDPRHGGNRNMASWKMVGLPYPPVRGREHYDQTKAG
ncbi:MAG: gluconate 2-dehydrogenase subunit 3 family protein [Acidobacteriia bacterium]|nr:gluconate 2-dehydrogenase subunit 3 family protein [Terriglobia bacterium]